jgi:membrane protease YdiL (CAAX protease family)
MNANIPVKAPARVPWRHVAGFVALAYAISWSVWASVMPDAWRALQSGTTPAAYTMAGLGMLGMFGPALAALVMRRFVTREGIRGSLGARRSWRHYAIAVIAPMIIVATSIAISAATGLADFHAGEQPLWALVLVLVAINTPLSTIATLGEEYGWRGYLLPKLLPLGQDKASLIVALVGRRGICRCCLSASTTAARTSSRCSPSCSPSRSRCRCCSRGCSWWPAGASSSPLSPTRASTRSATACPTATTCRATRFSAASAVSSASA